METVKLKTKEKRAKKQDLTICCLQETHFKCKDIEKLNGKEWEKSDHANTNWKKAVLAVLIY